MSNQSATGLGQKNLDDGFTTIHAPIKRHEGYNIAIGDFASSVLNVVYGFNKLLEHSVACDLKIKDLEAEIEIKNNHIDALRIKRNDLEHMLKSNVMHVRISELEAKLSEVTKDYDLVSAENHKLHCESIPILHEKLAEVEGQRNSCITVYEEQKDRLIEKLKVAVEALEFYKHKENWQGNHGFYSSIKSVDIEETDDEAKIFHGGKIAREALKKISEGVNEGAP